MVWPTRHPATPLLGVSPNIRICGLNCPGCSPSPGGSPSCFGFAWLGCFCRPPWHSWTQLLVDLPPCPSGFGVVFAKGVWNDVFTDGSCLCQASPLYRCAAWSSALVPPFGSIGCQGGFRLLAPLTFRPVPDSIQSRVIRRCPHSSSSG